MFSNQADTGARTLTEVYWFPHYAAGMRIGFQGEERRKHYIDWPRWTCEGERCSLESDLYGLQGLDRIATCRDSWPHLFIPSSRQECSLDQLGVCSKRQPSIKSPPWSGRSLRWEDMFKPLAWGIGERPAGVILGILHEYLAAWCCEEDMFLSLMGQCAGFALLLLLDRQTLLEI